MALHKGWVQEGFTPKERKSSPRIVSSPSVRETVFTPDPSDWMPPEEKTTPVMAEDVAEEKAREIVLYQLSDGPRSKKQLMDKMLSKDIPEETAVKIANRYEELGLINDSEFARMWVRSRHTGRGLGKSALRQELRKKGVPDDDIAAALEDVSTDDEFIRAVALVRKKAVSTVSLPHQKRVQRLASMLARKGYSSEMSFRAVKLVLSEENVELEPPETA